MLGGTTREVDVALSMSFRVRSLCSPNSRKWSSSKSSDVVPRKELSGTQRNIDKPPRLSRSTPTRDMSRRTSAKCRNGFIEMRRVLHRIICDVTCRTSAFDASIISHISSLGEEAWLVPLFEDNQSSRFFLGVFKRLSHCCLRWDAPDCALVACACNYD